MNILLIHQAFAALDEAGGTRHHELARFLVQNGHKVTVIASPVSYLTGTSSHKHKEVIEGVTILRAYTYNALHKSFVHRVFSFLSFMISSFFIGLGVRNVDVVWGTSPPIFQGLTAWVLARLKRARFLFEVRDLWPDFAIAVGVLKSPALIKMSLWLEKFLYQHADHMLVNSPGYVDHVRNRGARSVDLVPNGADPTMFQPEDQGADFRQAHNLGDHFVVLYAGAHGISNDLEIVLECAEILSQNPAFRFVFLGDGKEKSALQARAVEMGLKNVLFLPSVPKNEMAAALAGAQACIAILKPLEEYKTTYPNKVFDYMAAGRPVVLAIEGVIRDVVEQADCGVFPRPGDAQDMANAIQFLEADRYHAKVLGMHGREYLEEHFSREHIAEMLSAIFTKMLTRVSSTQNGNPGSKDDNVG
ncbi:MAG: glycosyltransferase family 4 protein [Chloroflexi bacterium]|nr:glycosyltransferase family 4 protein [Chloroflexota bacterium]